MDDFREAFLRRRANVNCGFIAARPHATETSTLSARRAENQSEVNKSSWWTWFIDTTRSVIILIAFPAIRGLTSNGGNKFFTDLWPSTSLYMLAHPKKWSKAWVWSFAATPPPWIFIADESETRDLQVEIIKYSCNIRFLISIWEQKKLQKALLVDSITELTTDEQYDESHSIKLKKLLETFPIKAEIVKFFKLLGYRAQLTTQLFNYEKQYLSRK